MKFKAFLTGRWLIALAAVAALSTCGREPDATDKAAAPAAREQALFRFVNATSYTDPVDVYVDEAKVLPDVSRDRVTDYSGVAADRHEIGVRVSGNVSSEATNSESLNAQERYTVVGFSKADGTPGVEVFHDASSQPEAGKARIRLIHVADGAAELGVFAAGGKDSILDGVHYSDESSADVDPGVHTLEIRKQGEKIVALKIPEISLQAGKTYTLVIAADQDRKLHAIPLDNAGLQQGSIR